MLLTGCLRPREAYDAIDVPILVLITGFQLFVLRQPIPHLRRLVIGGVYVVIGLAMFLVGLVGLVLVTGDTTVPAETTVAPSTTAPATTPSATSRSRRRARACSR